MSNYNTRNMRKKSINKSINNDEDGNYIYIY